MGLSPRRPAIELNDVAELAGKRTTARELHADVQILIELEKIEPGNRRLSHVDLEFRRLESALALTFLPSGNELINDSFSFADDAEICRRVAVRTGTHVGPANNNRQAACTAHLDQIVGVGLLKQHTAGHHHIGPGEIELAELLGVAIDQPD